MHKLQKAMSQDQHPQCHMEYIIWGWPESKNQLPKNIITYLTFRDDMAVIDGVSIKGRGMVIPEVLQQQALKQLYFNHIGIITKLLAYKYVYWTVMNADIGNHIKIVLHALTFSKLNQKKNVFIMAFQANHWKLWEWTCLHDIKKLPLPCRLSQQVSICKKAEDLSTDSLILACKIIFSEHGFLKKIMSYAGGNFISD